mmetsp:Transcript_19208/g.22935  ORF Transcript_19208/g.22935 Transcript_19208/m.22935 type:complete len:191 (+) Transcript_19208:115-687(+)|eukprot:CAMPEP_0197848784 /NCGR_PEP_ID=MMETSP1438-20131217/10038_1 /TAXON_ID=1461541 /ORGANISM="Pterosperma sp., Strain CCMP1384" /LENGTH=190 /DNA_ID=CAMNT_0043461195 /DNA_START=108 /DNA_END=680 /DNA_ORIENTATION=+
MGGSPGQKRKAENGAKDTEDSKALKRTESQVLIDDNDYQFLTEAAEEGFLGVKLGDGGPFGCVIVKDGKVIGKGHNEVLKQKDPTAHAEIVAIQKACKHLGVISLAGCDIYSSCEPCPMSFGAIYLSRLARLVYGAEAEMAVDQGFDGKNIADALRGTATFQKTECSVKKMEHPKVTELFEQSKEKYQRY